MPRLLLLSLTAASALLLTACDRQSSGTAQGNGQESTQKENSGPPKHPSLTGTVDRSHAGKGLADVTITHADGRALKLGELTGEPILLNIWATWCPPCIHEMPMLEELAEEFDGELRVVTVSEDIKGAEVVIPFLQENGFERLEPWLDPDNNLIFHYGEAGALPTTVLYDADGKEVLRVLGGYAWNSDEAKALIEEAL